jgi:TolB-like protein
MKKFLAELRRRKVFTVAVAYAVVAWLLLEVAATVFPIYEAPEWILKVFTTLLFLGFPVAMVLAWAYDITPEGVIRTEEAAPQDDEQPAADPAVADAGADTALDLPAGPSIAVLPFRNLSGEGEQDLFAEALGGDIITGLTQSSHLFVLAAGAAAGIDDPGQDMVETGKKLGVAYLLQGSVRKSGETLRVSTRLVDASNGVQIWSQNYDKQLSAESLFDVQDDIREQIVATLSDLHGVIYTTQSEKSIHRPTASLNAYECLSVALAYDKHLNEENHLRARESLERAVEIDPEFDEAWAHLSWIYTDEWAFGYNPMPDSMERALEVAQRAISLAPMNYHNHWLLSRVHYYGGDLQMFRAESEKALALNASDGTTLGLIGMYTAWSGEWERGMEMMSKAKLLNPNYPDYYHLVFGTAQFARGDYSAALKELQKMSLPEWTPAQIFLASTKALRNSGDDTAQHLQVLEQIQPGFDRDQAFGLLQRTFPFQTDMVQTVMQGLEIAGLS